MEALVSADWLKQRLGQPNLKVLDASWYMPVQARSGIAEFKAARIPGAQFFDIDGVSDTTSSLPHMLPTERAFAATMDELGVTPDTDVVVYDGMGIFSAPRAWWTFRVFGHDRVAVLDGGLPAWKAVGGEVDCQPAGEEAVSLSRAAAAAGASGAGPEPKYPAKLDKSKVRSLEQMLANIRQAAAGEGEQVMDARSAGRFVGTEPEPRAGLRGGHIPGARNVPFPLLLDSGRYKAPADLAQVFKQAGLDLDKPLVGSCGSGLTACILALGVHRVNGKLVPVYDGSWSEWGAREDVPVSTDP